MLCVFVLRFVVWLLSWHVCRYKLDSETTVEDRALCKPLKIRLPPSIFFDMTHDNPTIVQVSRSLCLIYSGIEAFLLIVCPRVQKRTLADALPTAALVSMAACACASTRGSDDLFEHNVCVVKENRLYPEYEDSFMFVKYYFGLFVLGLVHVLVSNYQRSFPFSHEECGLFPFLARVVFVLSRFGF